MKKIVRLLSWILLPLLLLVAACIFSLSTESGFRMLVGLGDSLAGSVFSVGKAQGSFLSSWQLKKVQLHLPGVVHVELDELSCQWTPKTLLQKELHLNRLHAEGLLVRFAEKEAAAAEDNLPFVLPDIRFPLALRIDDLQLHAADIFFSDSTDSFSVNDLILQASARDSQVTISRLHLESPDYGGDLQARLQLSQLWPVELSGSWRVSDPGIGDLAGSVKAKGDVETLQVSLALKTPAVATVQGQLTDLMADLHWQATGKTEHFALADLKLDVPVDGTLTVVEASGTLLDYGGTVSADIHYQGYPQVQVSTEVQGNYDGLNIHSLQLLLGEARLTSSGRIGWVGGFSWQADVQGEKLDPAQFVPEWPGTVNTRLLSQGKWSADKLVADITLDQLQGELRGFILAGSGSAAIDGETVVVDALNLQSGSTHVTVHGRINSELDLSFQAHSHDLASLLPESSGTFQLQGTVNGRHEEPVVSISLDAAELKVKEYLLQSLKAVVHADLSKQGHMEAEIDADGILVHGESINKARLQLQGNLEDHRLNFSLASSLGDLRLTLAGGVLEQQWQGELSLLQLQSDQFGEWQIQQPVPLRLAEESCELAEICFFQDQVQLLFTGNWEKEEGWQVHGGVENFSLQLLKEWKLFTPELGGMLSAKVMAGGKGVDLEVAEVTVSVPDLSLTAKDQDDEIRTWMWPENSIQAKLEQDEANITARSRFQDNSVAEFNALVANCCDLQKPEEITVSGKLDLDIKDLSPLTPLSGYTVNADGSVVGSYILEGTLAKPVVKGKMVLQDGEVMIPAAGIGVNNLELMLDGDGTSNKIALQVTSGKGSIKMDGVVKQDAEKEWQADLVVQGQDFLAVELSEYTVVVSPDIRCVYGKDGIALSGTMDVPRARIAPAGLQGSVSASRDVVVLNGNGEKEKSMLPLTLDLAVSLGEEVELDAFGIKGILSGRLKIEQQLGQTVTGLGNLNLHDGTFTFSDSLLEIVRGLVFYQGGAIDDPGLDVRARKKVNDKIVGIQVTGSVSTMEMNLFSDPHMEDSDILAYLLLGHDMSTASDREGTILGAAAATLGAGAGEGVLKNIEKETGVNISLASGEKASDVSLVVGKEIYDDLYISYGKGLTDSAGTFKARYDLKHGFSVETEVTAEGTGADLFWSLER